MDNINTDRNRNRLELYNTFILAIATMGVAWCSYQGALWGGVQTFRLAESNKYGRLSQQKAIQAGQNTAMEEAALINFVNAVLDNDQKRVDYVMKGVRPELASVLLQWMEQYKLDPKSAPAHPMITAGYNELVKKRLAESEKMSEISGDKYKEAQAANYNSDRYGFFGVLFSMVMFLGAVTTKLARLQPRLILSVLSTIICIGAFIWIGLYLPVAHKGG